MSDERQQSPVDDPREGVSRAPLLLITAWHLRRMRSMPKAFYHVRRLDLATRGEKGCLSVHRWGSRRSLMVTTTWESETDAHRWLNGARFTRTAAALRAIKGTVARVEQYRQDVTLDATGIGAS
jgi:heme-degrading monooxygenase HmoA